METSGIQEYLHDLFISRNRSERFEDLPRDLFIVAVDLDNGESVAFGAEGHRDVPVSRAMALGPEGHGFAVVEESVAFGAEGHRDVPVSRAVQASTALPGLYRPVRINGRDYVDGGVKKTAHINLAIQNGADLVICINPIVPVLNDTRRGPLKGHLSNRGVTYVLDQAMRIMLHGRMEYGMERYQREHPEVDILLIEPDRDDLRMFSYNIMRYSARRVVAEHGYQSTLAFFGQHEGRYRRILARHGIRLVDPGALPETPSRHHHGSSVARSLDASLDRLDSRIGDRARPRRRTTRRVSRTRASGGAPAGRRSAAG
jgi:predicted acylesterase/phospholipase RssA